MNEASIEITSNASEIRVIAKHLTSKQLRTLRENIQNDGRVASPLFRGDTKFWSARFNVRATIACDAKSIAEAIVNRVHLLSPVRN